MKVTGLGVLSEKSISLYGQDFTLSQLDTEEQQILEDNFNKLLATSDSEVRMILEERSETIVAGIMAIKAKLDDRKFRGLNPGDMEIGFGFIRPEFVKDTNTIVNDWNITLSGMGTWDTWLSGAGDSGGFQLDEDYGLIITHLVSQVTPEPFVRAAHFKIGRVDLIPEEVSDIILGDNGNQVAVYPVPTKIVLPEDELMLILTGHAGTEYLKLGGLVVGLGRLLKSETPSW